MAAKKAEKFLCELLQCYIAAQNIINKKKFSLSLIRLGNGKICIMVLLTLYFSWKQNYALPVLTTSRFLEQQLELKKTPHLRGTQFGVCHFISPTKDRKDIVFIVDEAEDYSTKNAVILREYGLLGGLASLELASRTFFVSATATNFLLNFAHVFHI